MSKMTSKTIIIAAFLSLLAGCKAEIKVDNPGIYHCTDTRDGETFAFDNTTARDGARISLTDACITITDFEGAERRLCKSHMDNWLKCVEQPE